MKKFVPASIALFALLLSGGTLLAQTSDHRPVVYKERTQIEFDDEVVLGQRSAPFAEVINARRRAVHSRLIHLRRNFRAELLRSSIRL